MLAPRTVWRTKQGAARATLRALQDEDAAERAKSTVQAFEEAWRSDVPFVSRAGVLLLGPRPEVAACAGPARGGKLPCVRGWKRWTELSRR